MCPLSSHTEREDDVNGCGSPGFLKNDLEGEKSKHLSVSPFSVISLTVEPQGLLTLHLTPVYIEGSRHSNPEFHAKALTCGHTDTQMHFILYELSDIGLGLRIFSLIVDMHTCPSPVASKLMLSPL